MKSSKEYIDSGILEQYVLGCTSPAESEEVALMAAADPAIREELEAINVALETYAMAHAMSPSPVLKPFLLATIDYTERLKNGEPATEPPLLNEGSVVEDYAAWVNREDMKYSGTENIYAKIIGYTPQAITAIVWIKDQAPQEVHDNEFEKFLVVEGSCNIMVEDEVNKLFPGDFFTIPLYKNHLVKVTSDIPCKIILQRVAA
ncbi:MAG: cupin domain-containing protein [Chitinophagaceae bacterium]|nr:cupin domain-containing protein [Chitinophagaceae bacterium]